MALRHFHGFDFRLISLVFLRPSLRRRSISNRREGLLPPTATGRSLSSPAVVICRVEPPDLDGEAVIDELVGSASGVRLEGNRLCPNLQSHGLGRPCAGSASRPGTATLSDAVVKPHSQSVETWTCAFLSGTSGKSSSRRVGADHQRCLLIEQALACQGCSLEPRQAKACPTKNLLNEPRSECKKIQRSAKELRFRRFPIAPLQLGQE